MYWTWKSRTRLGRPHLSQEVRDLIARMSRENRLWGTEKITGELFKLGIVVSNRSIRRYRWCGPDRDRSQSWSTFLRNQIKGIWAADLFVVQTINFKTLYVFFFISHARRELIHFNVTANPTAAWIWRQLIEATAWGRQPRHLIHDRDNVYGADFDSRRADVGVVGIRTPYRAPRANSIAERVVRTFRQECLDQVIVLGERRLLALLDDFVAYYSGERHDRRTFAVLQPQGARNGVGQPPPRQTYNPYSRRLSEHCGGNRRRWYQNRGTLTEGGSVFGVRSRGLSRTSGN